MKNTINIALAFLLGAVVGASAMYYNMKPSKSIMIANTPQVSNNQGNSTSVSEPAKTNVTGGSAITVSGTDTTTGADKNASVDKTTGVNVEAANKTVSTGTPKTTSAGTATSGAASEGVSVSTSSTGK